MKSTVKNLIPLIASAAIFASLLFSPSCANTTQAPTGGAKDTIPPVLTAVLPSPGSTLVPVHKTEIVFTFNEYVKLSDQKAILLSPPSEKPLKVKIKGKSVVVSLDEEDLKENTTYTIDVSGAIADNNEGNPFEGYVLTFSTGPSIDSMYVTGLVQDCSTLAPLKGATVMLYKDHADSAVFLHRPDAAARVDDWGFFCIRNIQDTLYRLYAITDENSDYMYSPENEKVAFLDSLMRPSHKVADGIYELYKFDMKDTASCLRRKTDYELNAFLGKNSRQGIKDKLRVGDRRVYVSFMAPYAQVSQVWFSGMPKNLVMKQFLGERDSLLMWINDQKVLGDTLHLNIEYMKTDSTGVLVKTLDKIKLPKDRKFALAQKSYNKDIRHEDTTAVYKVESQGEFFEQYGIKILFEDPLIKQDFDNMRYTVTNPRQETSPAAYSWERDSTDFRNYIVKHKGKILPGHEYKLTIPYRKFRNVHGYYNDSTVVSVKLPDDDKLSSLTLSLTEVHSHYIVDLMTEKRDKVVRSYKFSSDTSLKFPYLAAGKYCVRITEDANNNGRVDTGDLLSHRQSEKVKFYRLEKSSSNFIDIPASVDLVQTVNIGEMFK